MRQFTEDRELTAWFLLDLSGSVDFGSDDAHQAGGVRAASSRVLARLLTRHGNRVGALLYGHRVDAVLPPRAAALHVLEPAAAHAHAAAARRPRRAATPLRRRCVRRRWPTC